MWSARGGHSGGGGGQCIGRRLVQQGEPGGVDVESTVQV